MMSSATTNCRGHMVKHHLQEYLQACRKFGWTEYLVQYGTPRPNAATSDPAAVPKFTSEVFLDLLIKLITTCDLVSNLC